MIVRSLNWLLDLGRDPPPVRPAFCPVCLAETAMPTPPQTIREPLNLLYVIGDVVFGTIFWIIITPLLLWAAAFPRRD